LRKRKAAYRQSNKVINDLLDKTVARKIENAAYELAT